MGRYGREEYRRRFGGGMARGWDRPEQFGPPPWEVYGERFDRGRRQPGWNVHEQVRYDQPIAGYSGWRYDDGGYGERFGGAPERFSPPAGDRWDRTLSQQAGGDVDRIRAADIMTRNPEAVTPDTPLVEVARRMRDLDIGVMPVVDREESQWLQGIVTDRDIAVRAAAEGKDMKKTVVHDIMTPAVETVAENDHVRDVFSVMKRARVRRVPVTDAEGRLVGIIAQADLAVTYAGLDLQRETEVEEVIERISEPARPRSGRESSARPRGAGISRRLRDEIDLPDRIRQGWSTLRREARHIIRRGYDRGWR